jgi:histidine triad (HIT) family protein
MYNHRPEKYICPLCQIAKGEETDKGKQEEDVIFRDELITIYVAGKWWRSNPGHVIIIPNEHIENIYDMPEEIGHRIFDYSKKVAIALKEAYKCDGISTRQHNEHAGNQDVWHYHFHIFPRYEKDNLYINHEDTYWPSQKEKKPYVDKLKKCFSKN